MMSTMYYSGLRNFVSQYTTFRAARFKFTKVSQHQGETIDTFYNRILKLSWQCEFSDPDERLINAIIFGTNCVKAQDKPITDSPNAESSTMLNCVFITMRVLSYIFSKLDLISMLSSSDDVILLRKNRGFNHNRMKQISVMIKKELEPEWESDWSTVTFISRQILPSNKCIGCGCDQHNSCPCECPAWGQTCRKCNRPNHYESVCGMIPARRRQGNNAHSSAVNELNANQHNSGQFHDSNTFKFYNMVPKQVSRHCRYGQFCWQY